MKSLFLSFDFIWILRLNIHEIWRKQNGNFWTDPLKTISVRFVYARTKGVEIFLFTWHFVHFDASKSKYVDMKFIHFSIYCSCKMLILTTPQWHTSNELFWFGIFLFVLHVDKNEETSCVVFSANIHVFFSLAHLFALSRFLFFFSSIGN